MSKFKIPPKNPTPASPPPTTREEFVAGASMVQSQANDRPLKPIRLNLDLDPQTHRKLKLRALDMNLTMAELVRNLIKQDLEHR